MMPRVPSWLVILLVGTLLMVLFLQMQHSHLHAGSLPLVMDTEEANLHQKVQALQHDLRAFSIEAGKAFETANQIATRVQQLETQMSSLLGSSLTTTVGLDNCAKAKEISNVVSRSAMRSAGWKIKIDEMHFLDKGFLAWKNSEEIGSLAVQFHVSGRVRLWIENHHATNHPLNVVLVSINEDVVLNVQADATAQSVCIDVMAGDTLTLSEVYGQILVRSISFECGEQGLRQFWNEVNRAPGSDVKSDAVCNLGQRVWMRKRVQVCGRSEATSWVPGIVDQLLNESHAIIKQLENRRAFDEDEDDQFRIRFAGEMFTSPSADAQRCGRFPYKRAHFGLVTVADPAFQQRYAAQIKSMRCYARARKYDFTMLHANTHPACQYIGDIFYMKPCLVAKHLEEQSPDYIAVFLDADVLTPVLERGMEHWLRVDADLHFYERDWIPEVMSGIFMARNKPWVRTWLVTWSEMIFRRPPGFSSADNGALHQHFVETIQGLNGGGIKCGVMYDHLTVGVENRTPYWNFVECTNAVMGPPKTVRACATLESVDCGLLAIWPRLNFIAMDGHTLTHSLSRFSGPVIVHSIKSARDVARYFRNVDTCEVNEQAFAAKILFGRRAVTFSRCCKDLYPQLTKTCSQCVDRCLANFSCEPLPLDADTREVQEVIEAKTKVNVLKLP